MKLKDITRVQWIMLGVILALILVIIFREQVFENDIAKAKMEIFNTLLQDDPEVAKENIKNILDTLMNQ